MKFIRSFFLGAIIGLGIAAGILVGLYLSPLRQPLYFRADPEVAELRARLAQYQDKFSRDELRIAQEATPASDSLRATQARAWKEYLRWRGRMAELAKTHASASPGAIWPWIFSLRLGSFPLIAVFGLLPGILFGLRGLGGGPGRPRKSPRPRRSQDADQDNPFLAASPLPRGGSQPTASEAMKSFEAAVKQVARISDARAASTAAADEETQPRAKVPSPPSVDPRKTEFLPQMPMREENPEPPSPYDVPFEPDTKPFPMMKPEGDGAAPARKDRDTEFFQVGPGWGDSIRPGGDIVQDGISSGAPAAGTSGLSMEDEDHGASDDEDEDEETPGAFMPPTTEVERVERRKGQVLKLARKGLTSSEISRRLHMSQDQVEFIIRLRREKG